VIELLVALVAMLLGLAIGGFIIGAVARLAVPGPDPMPAWLTIAIGLAGFFIGGAFAYYVFGLSRNFVFGYVAAVLLVILYRRFVQKRGVTGPMARARPTRGWGLKRE
jgi:uncharacterized membrane protein YeaQ/YmgE (transglycosylase-associated protein family)